MDFIALINPPALVTRWDPQLRTAGVLHRVAALSIYHIEYKLISFAFVYAFLLGPISQGFCLFCLCCEMFHHWLVMYMYMYFCGNWQ